MSAESKRERGRIMGAARRAYKAEPCVPVVLRASEVEYVLSLAAGELQVQKERSVRMLANHVFAKMTDAQAKLKHRS